LVFRSEVVTCAGREAFFGMSGEARDQV